ncbi:MAG: preprotein translocase subunit YajC [Deltaproteobacteria bacterium]|nr:preprotein translocase subunit YajC [Deltaproteobacteria bacterium]
MLGDIAYAMAPGGGGGGGQGGFAAFIPLILLFAIFYFILIRPQQKRAKEHKQLLANIRKGDKVVTTGGLYGTITNLTDSVVTLEIADKVKVKVGRNYIAGLTRTE